MLYVGNNNKELDMTNAGMNVVTVAEVRDALPAHLKNIDVNGITVALNNIQLEQEEANSIRDNFLSYTNVLTEGKFKITDYMNAVVFVSYRLMKYSNREAYVRTFPDRHMEHVKKGTSDKVFSSFVSAYANTKLVNLILEQSLIPTWVLNQDKYQEAINQQFFLMKNAKSEMVQMQAANSILQHLKKPEGKEIQLSVTTSESKELAAFKEMMLDAVKIQKEAIESGVPTKTIASQKLIINADVDDAEIL